MTPYTVRPNETFRGWVVDPLETPTLLRPNAKPEYRASPTLFKAFWFRTVGTVRFVELPAERDDGGPCFYADSRKVLTTIPTEVARREYRRFTLAIRTGSEADGVYKQLIDDDAPDEKWVEIVRHLTGLLVPWDGKARPGNGSAVWASRMASHMASPERSPHTLTPPPHPSPLDFTGSRNAFSKILEDRLLAAVGYSPEKP